MNHPFLLYGHLNGEIVSMKGEDYGEMHIEIHQRIAGVLRLIVVINCNRDGDLLQTTVEPILYPGLSVYHGQDNENAIKIISQDERV